MATADVKIYTGTPIIFQAGGATTGSPYLMTLASLTTTSTAAWQSAKADLGTPRGAKYLVRLQCKMATSPTAALPVEVYWAGSPGSTAASSNPAGVSGVDGVYAGVVSAATAKAQLQFVGILALEATNATQVCDVGSFVPDHQYGSLVVANLANQAFETTTTSHIVTIYPIIDQIQASA